MVRDARQGATALPVCEQTVSENVLSNALNQQPLCFGRLWHPLRSVQELLQGGVGETDGEFVYVATDAGAVAMARKVP